MDYYQIGQRIRKYRKAHGMSQEQLAEKAGISVTHMSHIETGNTKLGLPVLVMIADALQVQCDDILRERYLDRCGLQADIVEILDSCSEKHLKIMEDILRSAKVSLEKYDTEE